MATKETFSGKMSSAYGNDLATPIPFSGHYTKFDTIDEVRAAGEYPSDKEVLGFVNARTKAKEVQKARTSALDDAGIKAPTNEDPRVALRNIVSALMAQNKSLSEDDATAMAKGILGQ